MMHGTNCVFLYLQNSRPETILGASNLFKSTGLQKLNVRAWCIFEIFKYHIFVFDPQCVFDTDSHLRVHCSNNCSSVVWYSKIQVIEWKKKSIHGNCLNICCPMWLAWCTVWSQGGCIPGACFVKHSYHMNLCMKSHTICIL